MDLTIDLTDGQVKGLEFATAKANAALPEDAQPVAPEAYLTLRVQELASSYERDMLASQESESAALRKQFAPTLNKVFALEPEKIQELAAHVDQLIAQLK